MKAQPMSAGDCILNLAAGTLLFCLLAVLLRPVYQREQAERDETVQKWIQEQRTADQAYLAEVEAERIRLKQIETKERPAVSTAPEPYNDPDIPDDIEAAAERWGRRYNISPEFLEAVAWTESRFDPAAESGGCVGLMQVAPRWHRDRMARLGLTEADLWEVDGCMAIAADYLRELFDTYDDPFWVLMTYNGDSNASAYLNDGAAPSEYALTVTELAAEYTQVHEEGGGLRCQEK